MTDREGEREILRERQEQQLPDMCIWQIGFAVVNQRQLDMWHRTVAGMRVCVCALYLLERRVI